MPKILFILTIISLLIFLPQKAEASSTISQSKMINKAEKMQAKFEDRLENLKQRALKEIDRRISSLNSLLTRGANLKRLTNDQKNDLDKNIKSQIASLEELKTKIENATDPQTLRTDIKSITSSYRVYALYMPMTQIVIAGENIINITEKLDLIIKKIETRISNAKSQGQDATSIENQLTDIKNKQKEAANLAQTAINTVINLTPSGYPGNKSSLQTARDSLQTARTNLQDIKQILTQMTLSIKSLKNN